MKTLRTRATHRLAHSLVIGSLLLTSLAASGSSALAALGAAGTPVIIIPPPHKYANGG